MNLKILTAVTIKSLFKVIFVVFVLVSFYGQLKMFLKASTCADILNQECRVLLRYGYSKPRAIMCFLSSYKTRNCNKEVRLVLLVISFIKLSAHFFLYKTNTLYVYNNKTNRVLVKFIIMLSLYERWISKILAKVKGAFRKSDDCQVVSLFMKKLHSLTIYIIKIHFYEYLWHISNIFLLQLLLVFNKHR